MTNRLMRSRTDVIIGGVCAGLGNYLGLDPILVRIFFVLLAIVGGSGVLVYLILWVIMPREDQVTTQGDLGERMGGIRDEMVASVSHPDNKAGLYIGIWTGSPGLVLLAARAGCFLVVLVAGQIHAAGVCWWWARSLAHPRFSREAIMKTSQPVLPIAPDWHRQCAACQ